jgi:bifunctional DNA-binding transcriptional regulator/antitoxin component of YhaV-PrlF toxin-antitoxin module
MANEKKGQLRVWHIPQVPGKAFKVNVKDVVEAIKILDILAKYDDFEFRERVKPDYSNVQGLEEFDGKEWCEYYNEDGQSITEIADEMSEVEIK